MKLVTYGKVVVVGRRQMKTIVGSRLCKYTDRISAKAFALVISWHRPNWWLCVLSSLENLKDTFSKTHCGKEWRGWFDDQDRHKAVGYLLYNGQDIFRLFSNCHESEVYLNLILHLRLYYLLLNFNIKCLISFWKFLVWIPV